MKKIYLTEESKELTYFIFAMNEKENEEIEFSEIEKIKAEAFKNSCIIKRAFFYNELKTIEKEAFKNCEKLEIFACIEKEPEKESENLNNYPRIEGMKISELNSGIFEIQTSAFESCINLETVILPQCSNSSKLIIEKSAFKGCSSLRTVVAQFDEISFTENPFEDCPEYLTFVCSKNSAVERFARENGYRTKNAK